MARRRMRVGIVGAGVMAEAIIAGLVADRAVEAGTLVASHPRRDRRDILAERHGIRPVASNREALTGAEVIVLAVKPQMLGRVMRELRGELSADQVVGQHRRRGHDPDLGGWPSARRRRARDAEHAEPDPPGNQRVVALRGLYRTAT